MKAIAALAAVGLVAFSACSSDEEPQPLGIELRTAADHEAEVYTFEATGDSVDEGLMCASGDWIWHGNETPDGDELTDAQLGEMWSAGEPFDMVVVNEYECGDGTGSIVTAELVSLDPAEPDRPSEVVGSWSLRSGEIDGVTLTGDGDIIGGETVRDEGYLTGTLTESN